MVIFAFKEDCFVICPKEKLSGHAQSRVYSFEFFFHLLKTRSAQGLKCVPLCPT